MGLLIKKMEPGKLVLFNSTDNYETPKYQVDVYSGANDPQWLGTKLVGNNLLLFKIVSPTTAQLLKIHLPTLGSQQVNETVLQQIEFEQGKNYMSYIGFLDCWGAETVISKLQDQGDTNLHPQ